jgi:primosomal protein N' (replication factor Y) (superfamily II helicase)
VRDVEGALSCTVCGTTRPLVCLHCHATRFRPVKPGVAHVRDDLAALLPRVPVGLVDASTDQALDAPVLVGTEAVLHRVEGRVGLVAFLELDQELLAPRVRAAEQALWLLVRGARLLDRDLDQDRGRGPDRGLAGRLLVQTRLPDHVVVRAACAGDGAAVARADHTQRALLGFPPFGGLAALRGEAVAVTAACDALRHVELADRGVVVLGPVDDGRRALVRAPSWEALADALATPAVDAAHALGRLRVDVDPRRD